MATVEESGKVKNATAQEGSVPSPLVLLVLPDPGRRATYATTLRDWGFRVVEAASVPEAVRSVADSTPDVIAGETGFDAAGKDLIGPLTEHEALSQVPVVRLLPPGRARGGQDHGVPVGERCRPELLIGAIVSVLAKADRRREPAPQAQTADTWRAVPAPSVPSTRPKPDRRTLPR